MTDTVLETKLYIPPVRSSYVPRPHLISKLNTGLDGKLILISAPAGYGKTTLVADWLRQADTAATWLSLEERDNDPARFMTYLIAALQRIQKDIGYATLELIQAAQPPPPEAILTVLINEIASLPVPFILALDDYHCIHALPIHEQLNFLVEHKPHHMHLVIMTREDPPLPFARLRANSQLLDIRQEDLRFSPRECAEFLQDVMRLDLVAEDVASLERRTEGWIAGLQLAALSLQGSDAPGKFIQDFTGSSHYILDYLLEEVFNLQSPDVQDFLLKTSILERLSGPLCDAVAERSGSQGLIETLEAANLFVIPLDQSRSWYRYHRLFADLLRHRLQAADQISPAHLHQLASQWYLDTGPVTEAMHHALEVQDWDIVKKMITTASAQTIKEGHLATLARWNTAIPEEIIRTDYRLATFKSWASLILGQFRETSFYVDLAEHLFPEDAPPAEWSVLYTLRSYLTLVRHDIAGTIQWATRAIEICSISDPYGLLGGALTNLAQAQVLSGNLESAINTFQELVRLGKKTGHRLTAVSALANLAQILNVQGKRMEALSVGKQALELCTDFHGRPMPLAGLAHWNLGMLYTESNELEQARHCLLLAIDLSKKHGQQIWVLSSMLELARLYQMLEEEESAFSTIQDAHQYGSALNYPRMKAQIAAYEADIYVKAGNLTVVERWAEAAGLSPEIVPNLQQEREFFTYARLLLKKEQLDKADMLLENLEHFARHNGRMRTLITVYILQALCQHARDQHEQSIERIKMALELATPEGYIRAFLEEGSDVADLLSRVNNSAPEFVADVISAFGDGKQIPDVQSKQDLIEPLSKRELDVLRLVTAGLSNREIAGKLIISVGTVKTHVHNIYGKLGVRGRTQAVARAIKLKLI